MRNILFGLTAFLIIIVGTTFQKFYNSHFDKNTSINGVDCSWLTTEQACEKLNTELTEKVMTFVFTDNLCTFTGSDFDLQVFLQEIEDFLIKQKTIDKQLDFEASILFNDTKLTNAMKSIPNLDTANMVSPKNAYITLSEDNLLCIIPEVTGNYIDFNEAVNLAHEGIQAGYSSIDFSSITASKPQIFSEDLQIMADSVNNILNTTITFNLNNDSSITLDKSIMKDWIVVDETGNYSIDVESNLSAFVDQLAEKASGLPVYFEFQATDLGPVTVPTKNLTLNKEAEIELIKSELGTAQSYTHTPIYNINIGGTYVEVDISRQHVWLYKDSVCIMDTDCVTGTKNKHDTREGYFFLTDKVRNKTLHGYNDDGSEYNSPVDFWMPFDGGIGLHDAYWRYGVFGGDIYLTHGSHGCVNLPRNAAETIYNTIDFTTPIIVYCSSK